MDNDGVSALMRALHRGAIDITLDLIGDRTTLFPPPSNVPSLRQTHSTNTSYHPTYRLFRHYVHPRRRHLPVSYVPCYMQPSVERTEHRRRLRPQHRSRQGP